MAFKLSEFSVSRAANPNNFGVELEDYLAGLTSLPSELVRHTQARKHINTIHRLVCA